MWTTIAERIVVGLFVLLLFAGAAGHVLSPEFYAPMVPEPIPLWLANALSTVAEAAIGLALLVPSTRWLGAMAFVGLMVAFLPIHIWDLFREAPAVGSAGAAVVRLVFQALFIGGGAWLVAQTRARAPDQAVGS